MPFPYQDSYNKGADGVLLHPPDDLLQASIIIFMKRSVHMTVSLCLEFKAPKLVKVKAHFRRIHGKVVIVRSYYRCVEGRLVDWVR